MRGEEDKKTSGSRKQLQGLPLLRPDVAGIDLGSQQHWVCAPTVDGTGREVAGFGATTSELIRLAEWLKARHVKSVAMESTGVYWIAPHEILEAQGLEVLLVDTRQLASVPGRDDKSDPTDCEWIQRLHSCGLLRGSFRPPEAICMLRTLVRDKGTLVAESGDWVRRMQKSLDQMNVRVHRAVSDIDGVTGMAILRAIADGERRRGEEPMRQALYRMSGVDATQIDAIGVETMAIILSEYGPDLSRFATEKEFVSHATLAPRVPKSGGKPLKKKKPHSASTRVANALRMAALSLRHSNTALGAYYRHLAQRKGADIAVFASARKLATHIYRLLRWGQPYIDEGAQAYETRYEQQRLKTLGYKAKSLGYQLIPLAPNPQP